MSIEKIHEAFKKWRDTAEITDKHAFADSSSRDDNLENGFYAGYKAALSTIDPDAIRRECAKKAAGEKYIKDAGRWNMAYNSGIDAAIAAIMGKEEL